MALFGGAIVVLMLGLFRARTMRAGVVPAATVVALLAALGLTIWQWNRNTSIMAGALRVDDFALAVDVLFMPPASRSSCSRCATPRPRRPATASTTRCSSPRSEGWRSSPRPRT